MDEKFLRELPPGGANQVAEREDEGKWNKQVQKGQQSNNPIKFTRVKLLSSYIILAQLKKSSFRPSHFVVALTHRPGDMEAFFFDLLVW